MEGEMQADLKAISGVVVTPHKRNRGWLGAGVLIAVLVLLVLSVAACAEAEKTGTLSPEISVEEAQQMYQDGAFFLDVRTQEEWDEFHIPNTTLIPLNELESRLSELPDDEEIVVVCRSGNRSQSGRDILLNSGFEQATSMAGGVTEWRSKGYPTE
jgi:rhodanese-related sulfurtransferase